MIDELIAQADADTGHGAAAVAPGQKPVTAPTGTPWGRMASAPPPLDLGSALDTANPDPSGPHRSGLLPKGLQ